MAGTNPVRSGRASRTLHAARARQMKGEWTTSAAFRRCDGRRGFRLLDEGDRLCQRCREINPGRRNAWPCCTSQVGGRAGLARHQPKSSVRHPQGLSSRLERLPILRRGEKAATPRRWLPLLWACGRVWNYLKEAAMRAAPNCSAALALAMTAPMPKNSWVVPG